MLNPFGMLSIVQEPGGWQGGIAESTKGLIEDVGSAWGRALRHTHRHLGWVPGRQQKGWGSRGDSHPHLSPLVSAFLSPHDAYLPWQVNGPPGCRQIRGLRRVVPVQGLGAALKEGTLAQTGRALGPASELRLGSGP